MAIGIRIDKSDRDGPKIYITRGGQNPEQIVLPYDETAVTAQRVFGDIYYRNFSNQGIDPPETAIDLLCHYEVCAEHMMTAVGEDLSRIAARIEASNEREMIRQRAQCVNLRIDSYERFSAVLKELFPDNLITRERIVVLFFFCSDIALRAYNSSPIGHFHELLSWTLKFIFNQVCSMVREQGGWNKVISNFFQGTAITVCAILGSMAFAVYFKGNF